MKRNHWIGLGVALIAVAAIVWTLAQSAPTHSPVAALPDATVPLDEERPKSDLADSDSPAPGARESVPPDAPSSPGGAASVPAASMTTVRGKVADDRKSPVTRFELRPRLADEPEDAHVALLGYMNLTVDD